MNNREFIRTVELHARRLPDFYFISITESVTTGISDEISSRRVVAITYGATLRILRTLTLYEDKDEILFDFLIRIRLALMELALELAETELQEPELKKEAFKFSSYSENAPKILR